MFNISKKLIILNVLLLFSNTSIAGQGFTCHDFNKLNMGERKQYIKGYTLGAAMELKYLKNNLSEEIKGIEYIQEKYDLINIAVSYRDDFFNHVENECKTGGASGAGMFDVLPSVLLKMQKTGKYKVWGM